MEEAKKTGTEGLTGGLLEDPSALQVMVIRALREKSAYGGLSEDTPENGIASSVMLLLGRHNHTPGGEPETCMILNKRSRKVPQAGDLCCPGGAVDSTFDRYFARLLTLPGLPLALWPCWSEMLRKRPREARFLSLLLATGLRESWEEMRLNPFFVRFLGPLPVQRLLLFHRIIYPMVGWVNCQKRFLAGWEVEKVIHIPLRALLNSGDYARYRLFVPPHLEKKYNRTTQDYPCFLYRDGKNVEMLWGATYRIVADFVRRILGFVPPDFSSLPIVSGVLDEGYFYARE